MIFLLGGEGFVGSGYARALRERGLPFEIITRANYAQHVGRECDLFINANGNSSKILAKKDPKFDFRASVESVRDTLIDFRFGTYLFLSSGDVYPDCSSPELTREDARPAPQEQSPYGFHKRLAEQCVEHGAERWLIVRQGGFVGPGLKKNAVFDILHGDKVWVHPASRFQFIHTDDSAYACLDLVNRGISGEIVNVTATGTMAVRDIMTLAGKDLPFPEDAVAQSYEMSVAKAQAAVALPSTEDCVRKFLLGEGRLS